ncbi:MAG: hypothetical protein K2K40_09800 [Paramuribaculum sp.]|nr:hypothetical protein [Paramuribaculum sp.]
MLYHDTQPHGYRYRLGRRRGMCPSCHRRDFKYYVDTLTGEILDSRCGRCNREHSCGYHEPPSHFPDIIQNIMKDTNLTTRLLARPQPAPATSEPPSLMPLPMVKATLGADRMLNSLYRFFLLHYNTSFIMEAFKEMEVGTARFGGGSPVFWLRDRFGNYRSGKVMAYDSNTGHRVKSHDTVTVNYAHSLARLPGYNFQSCYYGEYNAARYPDGTIILVESEKSALVLRMMLAALSQVPGRYLAMATSGASNFSVDPSRMADPTYRMSILYNRNLIVIPDADMVDRWQKSAMRLKPFLGSLRLLDVRTSPFGLEGSDDIADWILDHGHRLSECLTAIRTAPRI